MVAVNDDNSVEYYKDYKYYKYYNTNITPATTNLRGSSPGTPTIQLRRRSVINQLSALASP